MVGCAALNCSNHSRNGFKFFRFPADEARRRQWLINCRRKDWVPSQNDRLCMVHFEQSQIEQNRADGQKRLKPFAIPTIFDVRHPPKLIGLARRGLCKKSKVKDVQNQNSQNPVNFNATSLSSSGESNKLGSAVEHTNNDQSVANKSIKIVKKLEEELKSKNYALAKDEVPIQSEKD